VRPRFLGGDDSSLILFEQLRTEFSVLAGPVQQFVPKMVEVSRVDRFEVYGDPGPEGNPRRRISENMKQFVRLNVALTVNDGKLAAFEEIAKTMTAGDTERARRSRLRLALQRGPQALSPGRNLRQRRGTRRPLQGDSDACPFRSGDFFGLGKPGPLKPLLYDASRDHLWNRRGYSAQAGTKCPAESRRSTVIAAR
jgi:hypothetical protein